MARAMFSLLLFWLLAALLLFGAAGRLDVPAFWIYLAIMLLPSLVVTPFVERRNPGLLAERMRPGPGERDRVSQPALVLGLVVVWVLAGLDVGRVHWSRVPAWLSALGLALVALGYGLVAWSMFVNRFFSSAVRLQWDRGHEVISSGPYALVRHPGYAGGILLFLGTGLALGSWWTFPVLGVVIAGTLRRAALEDRLLFDELPGYADYARRVRFRLLPGVW